MLRTRYFNCVGKYFPVMIGVNQTADNAAGNSEDTNETEGTMRKLMSGCNNNDVVDGNV